MEKICKEEEFNLLRDWNKVNFGGNNNKVIFQKKYILENKEFNIKATLYYYPEIGVRNWIFETFLTDKNGKIITIQVSQRNELTKIIMKETINLIERMYLKIQEELKSDN